MIESAILIAVLAVGIMIGYGVRSKYLEVEREDAVVAKRHVKTAAQETIDKLTEERHVLARRNLELENKIKRKNDEIESKTLQIDSEIANYQEMLTQVEEDQLMLIANHQSEIESLQAQIIPPKDYPDEEVETAMTKAAWFDTLHPYFQKMAARQYAAVTDNRG